MELLMRNGKKVLVRLLQQSDIEKLYNYLSSLSTETKSRFGPHPFDWQTIENICNNTDDVKRYVAIDEPSDEITAYMLFKQGMIYWDQKRYAEHNQHYNYSTTVTYAPSVADAWQSSGLGSAMYMAIEPELKSKGVQHIILWGGVQAGNERAVNFYKKVGYDIMGSFWHDEKDNLDMVKQLT